jgi:branched-chain amino acid transport system ATP-binding protein
MSAAPLLEVRNLRAFYGQAQVLFGVSLHLRPGEVVALIGRNGAGKSTTLKAIMGLLTAEADAVTFLGRSIARLPSYRIARLGLGYVPEERRIFTDLTVTENLEVGRQPARHGRPLWTPERLFDLFPNLAEMRHRPGGQMSGGEQQMLSIARTLMGNPDAILLDEPSEGLAPLLVDQIGAAIQAMAASGVAVLLVEQDLHLAFGVAHEIAVMAKGAIVHRSETLAFRRDPATAHRLLGASA